MQIEQYPIVGRRPRFAGSLASVTDFLYATCEQPSYAQKGGVELRHCTPTTILTVQEFLDNPHYSLYCFDPVEQRAIFVALPPALDLTLVPFAHQAQYEAAHHMVTMPIELFHRLAQDLPTPTQPIFLYMAARSGSTVLSHALNASGYVSSLSEPDAVTQLVHLREGCGTEPARGFHDEELVALATSTMRHLFRPQATHLGAQMRPRQAVKFRSEGVRVMDLFQRAFPTAVNLFLYRDTLGWVNSFQRIFTKLGLDEPLPVDEWQQLFEGFLQTDLCHLRRYLAPTCTVLSLVEQLTLWWIAIMEWYLAQWQQGTPVLAVRYQDLNTQRALTLEAIFAHCGLLPTAVAPALTAFATDAQAGTALARDKPEQGAALQLEATAVAEIIAILQRHPQLRHPHFWAPGTLDLTLYRNSRQLLRSREETARMSDSPSPAGTRPTVSRQTAVHN